MLRVSLICGLVVVSGAIGPAPAFAQHWFVHLLPGPARPHQRKLSARLDGVSCPSPTWCLAVGTVTARPRHQRPLIEQWNGARWSRQWTPRPRDGSLDAVSCSSDRTCVAVGSIGSHGLVERLSHGAWTGRSLSEPLTGVSCARASACTAVGGTLALRWDGSSWRRQRTARPRPTALGGVRLDAVSCPSTRSCLAVGSNGCESLVERWNGSSWTVLPTPDDGDCTKRGTGAPSLAGVSCASASMCFAVGTVHALNESQVDRPLTERWDGLRWSTQRTSAITSAISCPASRSCTAVGVQPPLVNGERWNGRQWIPERLPVPRTPTLGWSLDAVSCPSPAICIAVGGLTDYSATERPVVAEYRGAVR
jgi:hypothetical protein